MKLRDKISLVYKFFVLVVLGIGLVLNFRLDHSGKLLLYFTILSNLSCFIFYLIAFILKFTGKIKKNDFYYILKGLITMAISCTMIVYWLMHVASGVPSIYKYHMTACRFVHLYAPIMVMLDYAIFAEKGNLKSYYPFIWTASLIVYGTFIIIYMALGGTFINNDKFLYSFMDYDKLGIGKVILSNIILLIAYTSYGCFVQNIDYNIGSKKSDKK